MSAIKRIQEYIDSYRKGEITESDFKHRLGLDVELQQEFERYQKDLLVIRSAAREQLKNKAALVLENHEKKSVKMFSMKRILQIAAVFIFVIMSVYLLQIGQSSSSADLFATHFELPVPASERNDTQQNQKWQAAMTVYSNQDYKTTITLLSPLVTQNNFTYPDRGKLYLGVSYLMVNKNQKAIDIFNTVSLESTYAQSAEWYRALSFLKIEDKVAAKTAFQKIANQRQHFKQKAALKILEHL